MPNTTHGEPPFEQVYNPENWSPFTLRAKFSGQGKLGKYKYRGMPAGSQVVPRDATGGRFITKVGVII